MLVQLEARSSKAARKRRGEFLVCAWSISPSCEDHWLGRSDRASHPRRPAVYRREYSEPPDVVLRGKAPTNRQ
jgi:hypothetical protein